MKISIVIPNYNGEDILESTFPKVVSAALHHKKTIKNAIEIIVVDDASTDQSVRIIKSLFKSKDSHSIELQLIQHDKNQGFSTTVNNGVAMAHGDVVILLNTDVSPEEEFIDALLPHFDDQKIFAVGCMDKSIERGKVVLRGRGIGSWKRGFLVHSRGDIEKTNTLWVSGGSGAFRKTIWEKLGGLDELYNPFYWEDIDLSYRALKSGYALLFESKSIVVHQHEKGAIKIKYSPFLIKKIAYRNQVIFSWINATDLDLQFLHLFWLPYHCLSAIFRLDFAFIWGLLNAALLLPKIIRSSFHAQKLFTLTDKKVIQQFTR